MDSSADIGSEDQLRASPCKGKDGESPTTSPDSSLTTLTNFSDHAQGLANMNYPIGPGVMAETRYHYEGTLPSVPECFPAFRDSSFDPGVLQTSWSGGNEHPLGALPMQTTMPDDIGAATGFISARPSLMDIAPQQHHPGPPAHCLYPRQSHYQPHHHPYHAYPMPTAKPKRRRVATLAQRKAANIRERKRMFSLNDGFDKLRKIVPTFAYEKKLSRIETLHLAMVYIAFMTDIVNGVDAKTVKLKKSRSSFDRLKKISMGSDQHHPTLPATSSSIPVGDGQEFTFSEYLNSH